MCNRATTYFHRYPKMNVSPFDNELSLLYKWANLFEVPVKYVLVRPATPADQGAANRLGDTVYEPVLSYLLARLERGTSLADLYAQVMALTTNLTNDDFAMVLTAALLSRQVPLDEIRNQLNTLFRELRPDNPQVPFPQTQDLITSYQGWSQRFTQQVARDRERLQTILDLQEELGRLVPLHISPLKISQMRVLVTPGRPPQTDGLDLFNQAIVTSRVPFIQFNDEAGRRYYKIWKEFPHNPNLIIQPSAKANAPNTFYFTLWLDETRTNKDVFVEGTYSIETNRFIFPAPVREERTETALLQEIGRSFPTLTLENPTALRISGEFSLYDIQIDDASLMDMIMLVPLFNTYLYVEETTKSFAEKKRLSIHYKSVSEGLDDDELRATGEGYIKSTSSVIVTLTSRQSPPEGETVTVLHNGVPTQFALPAGSHYLQLKVKKATNQAVAEKFIEIFRRLMYFYREHRAEVEAVYNEFIPARLGTLQLPKETKKKAKRESRLDQLQEKIPDLFVKRYARKCQAPFQPIIIEPHEIEAWRQRRFLDKGEWKERQVMPFPPTRPQWYFVCPDDANPYPGMKKNTNLGNEAKYPYYPCCYNTDHMDPAANTHYNEYYRGIPYRKTQTQRATHKIKTDRFLEPGRLGYIPRQVMDILAHYKEGGSDFSRLGVPRGPNSLLHCVLVALNDPVYLAKTPEQQEAYVISMREYLAATVVPALLKQELYDQSDAEIRGNLANTAQFLDPRFYYRALEEVFNINLYVFMPSEEDETAGFIDIPRNKLFHVHAPRLERQTVLIFKHWGATSDASPFPQCELIVDYDASTRQSVKVFGKTMTTLVHDALLLTDRNVSYTLEGTDVTVRSNFFSLVNYLVMVQGAATAQLLDDYGKLRGLVLPNGVTIVTPPSQPENLPVQAEPTATTVELARAMFWDVVPTRVAKRDDRVVGLWYALNDLEQGLFVPIQPTTELIELPVGAPNPLEATGVNVINRTRKLRRDLAFILQLIRWLYFLYLLQQPQGTPETFIQNYLTVAATVPQDSADAYDLSRLPRHLPVVTSVAEGIAALSPLAPTLFQNGRVVMYSPGFAVKIQQKIRDLAREMVGIPVELPRELEHYYERDSDFQKQPETLLFVSERDLNLWYASIMRPSYQGLTIRQELHVEYDLLDEPYLYRDAQGRIYEIQNVVAGDRLRALNVAQTWFERKVNRGFNTMPLEGNPAVHIIYSISTADTPIIQEDLSYGSPVFLQILTYGNNRYAAMLPLL